MVTLPELILRGGTRCNKHLLTLGKQVKRSLVEADLTAYQFGTVGVSDGISMGTKGMSYSLQSRDLIADAVETAAGGHWLDGMVVIPGCDKNMPGVLMARTLVYLRRARLQRPGNSRHTDPTFSWATEPPWADDLWRDYPPRLL